MGTDDPRGYASDGEAPAHRVKLSGYRMGIHTVTNDQFAAFVEATGHRTTAEVFGTSFVFVGLLPDGFPPTRAVAAAPWWREVVGADWRHPEGPQSNVDGPRPPPGRPCELVRRQRVLHLGRCPAPDRGRVGAGSARPRGWPPLPLG